MSDESDEIQERIRALAASRPSPPPYSRVRLLGGADPSDVSNACAIHGARDLAWLEHDGYRVSSTMAMDWQSAPPEATIVPVGGVDQMRTEMRELDIRPRSLEMPPPIAATRRIMRLDDALLLSKTQRFFVKSLLPKQMTADIWGPDAQPDGYGFLHLDEGTSVVVDAEVCEDIVSEYRVIVHGGEIQAVRHYAGDPMVFPSPVRIREDIARCEAETGPDGKWAPIAYSADFMVHRSEGKLFTRMIECNDAWSLGDYGTQPAIYFKALRARWLQLLREQR